MTAEKLFVCYSDQTVDYEEIYVRDGTHAAITVFDLLENGASEIEVCKEGVDDNTVVIEGPYCPSNRPEIVMGSRLSFLGMNKLVVNNYYKLDDNSGALYDSPEDRENTRAEARHIILAVFMLAFRSGRMTDHLVFNLCKNITNGYGCWLEDIWAAFDLSSLEPPEWVTDQINIARNGVWAILLAVETADNRA